MLGTVATSVEVTLISVGGTLLGVILGLGGTYLFERQRARDAGKAQRRQAVAELLTATVDLITAGDR